MKSSKVIKMTNDLLVTMYQMCINKKMYDGDFESFCKMYRDYLKERKGI